MQCLLMTLVFTYVLVSLYFFKTWIFFFRQEVSLSSEDILLSKIVLVTASILWPIVVPISYIKLIKKQVRY